MHLHVDDRFDADAVLVVGSGNSSNSRRLVEVAERAGCRSLLVENAGEIPPEILVDAGRIGLTAGASAPESLVAQVVSALDGMGGATVSERTVATEDVRFKLPPEVRKR
jgi:4-hydroxy-3-methylbut-2-enyl diphosphate reductase